MKKYCINTLISLLCLILLCSVMISCTSNITSSNTTVLTTDERNENPIVDIHLYYIHDLNEYRSYIVSADYSHDFVHYDSIAKLGEFVTFGYSPLYKDSYWYVLRDGDQEIRFYVRSASWFNDPENDSFLSLDNDLSNVKKICTAKIGSAWYFFNNGVSMIAWTDSMHSYELSGLNSSQAFQEKSLVSRLLYRESAPLAIDELKEDILKSIQ